MPPQGPYGAPPSYTPPQPSFPAQAPPPTDPSRYEFFMSPSKPPRRSPLSFSGGSFGGRVAIIVGGAVLLMVIVGIALSFIPSNLNTADLTSLGTAQGELLTVCANATSNAKNQATLNFAMNCTLSMTTSQSSLFAYTSAHGLKLKAGSKALTPPNAAQIATTLKASIASSTYDTTFTQISQTEMNAYLNQIKATFKDAKSTAQKQLLNTEYKSAQLLNTQLAQATSAAASD